MKYLIHLLEGFKTSPPKINMKSNANNVILNNTARWIAVKKIFHYNGFAGAGSLI